MYTILTEGSMYSIMLIHGGVIKKEDTWFAKQYTTNTLHSYEEDTPHPHTLPQNQQTLQKQNPTKQISYNLVITISHIYRQFTCTTASMQLYQML